MRSDRFLIADEIACVQSVLMSTAGSELLFIATAFSGAGCNAHVFTATGGLP